MLRLHLRLTFRDAKGRLLRKAGTVVPGNSRVSLIQSKAVPARATSFVEAVVEKELLEGAQVLFEPDPDSLEVYGLSATESLVQVRGDGIKGVHSNGELSADGCSFGGRHDVGTGGGGVRGDN